MSGILYFREVFFIKCRYPGPGTFKIGHQKAEFKCCLIDNGEGGRVSGDGERGRVAGDSKGGRVAGGGDGDVSLDRDRDARENYRGGDK